jgi:hypothetical protein
MSTTDYAKYVQECGVVAELISLNTATRFVRVPQVEGRPIPDGVYVDECGFTHALEIKSVTTLTSRNSFCVRKKLKYACKQLKGFDYTVIHIHVLKITEHLLHLVSHLEVDLVVLFTGGEPVKTLFLPRR